MAMTGVLRPGHAQIRVLDLEESIHFYTEVVGLKETGRDAQGRVYFKAWDEHDHNSVILRQADRAGLDFFGFKVLDEATLTLLEKGIQAQGVATERMPAGEMLATGERVRFTIPTGHVIELYATKDRVGNGLPTVNPDAWPDGLKGMAPTRPSCRLPTTPWTRHWPMVSWCAFSPKGASPTPGSCTRSNRA